MLIMNNSLQIDVLNMSCIASLKNLKDFIEIPFFIFKKRIVLFNL